MTHHAEVLCIGSVLWDVIGRAATPMGIGSDVPGRITRLPGGVAMNIAMTLRRFQMQPALLTALGKDAEGDELLAACAELGLVTSHIYHAHDLPTDRYMAVEGSEGLVAAIADARSLEKAGNRILRALEDGTLGSPSDPYSGVIALDGNLTVDVLAHIAGSPLFRAADLRVAPASPGKAERLAPLLSAPNVTVYVNLEEAAILAGTPCSDALTAARALMLRGAARVLVTDGVRDAAYCGPDGVCRATPPRVPVTRVTGAGDTFMAAHIVADAQGLMPQAALDHAVRTAAEYVAGHVT